MSDTRSSCKNETAKIDRGLGLRGRLIKSRPYIEKKNICASSSFMRREFSLIWHYGMER